MDDFHHTGWDPYQSLLQCENNVQQCALAINRGSQITKDIIDKTRHQQEVIEQLIFQNNKLRTQVDQHQRLLDQINQKLLQLTS